MEVYCSRSGLQASQANFVVDCEVVADDDITGKLGLQHGDLIDVATDRVFKAPG